MKKSDKCHSKTHTIEIMFANGETETLRNLTSFSSNILFEAASKRPVLVTETARIAGETWRRTDREDWYQVTA